MRRGKNGSGRGGKKGLEMKMFLADDFSRSQFIISQCSASPQLDEGYLL